MFIIYFILASIITIVALYLGTDPQIFDVAKFLSKFFIVMAMAAIGVNTNVSAIIKSGFKPFYLVYLLGRYYCYYLGNTVFLRYLVIK